MGAPQGNQNGAKAKQWAAAVERAIERLADPSIDPDKPHPRSPRAKGLDILAEKFIATVQEGSVRAFVEIGDRLDGKPAQQLQLAGHDGEALTVVLANSDASA